jgi:predicted alpha/beta hydrolase
MCSWALARAHAKASGKAVEIASYLGSGNQIAEALTEYAFAYAEQNRKDYDTFMRACRSGKLEARSDEDMAADFRV